MCLVSLHLILQEYKFFLAFENSLCRDYITEKFWLRALDNNIVPVVMNLGNMSRTAPEQSYIDFRDFESPRVYSYINTVKFDCQWP